MNKFNFMTEIAKVAALILLISTFLTACSGEKAPQGQEPQQSSQQTTPQSQPAPATANQAASSDPYQLPKNGKVVKAMHAGGYTYMQVEKDGKEFWIAATMMNVKRDDYVRWADPHYTKPLMKFYLFPTLNWTNNTTITTRQ